mgnify:CR=1 FL=1
MVGKNSNNKKKYHAKKREREVKNKKSVESENGICIISPEIDKNELNENLSLNNYQSDNNQTSHTENFIEPSKVTINESKEDIILTKEEIIDSQVKTNNEEITHLKTIIGLKQGEDYSNDEKFNNLRYGHIILLTDADTDGFHIKGLFINMVHSLWPTLVKRPEFITSLMTPIVKAFKNKETLTFYNLTDYDVWKELPEAKTFKVKYYKGLGTSTSLEAKEYFTDIDSKLINYLDDKVLLKEVFLIDQESGSEEENDEQDEDDEDNIIDVKTNEAGENLITINTSIKPKYTDPCTEVITLAFEKKRADDRKKWLGHFDSKIVLENSQKKGFLASWS